MATTNDIEARVKRLEDEREIVQNLYQYANGLDYGPEEAFLDVFTENASWRRADGRYGPRSFEGRSALTQMYRDHTHAPEYFHKHLVANAQIDVHGDQATARSYLLLVTDDREGPYVRAFSRCTDMLVRCDDGRWRIQERRAELESRSERSFPPQPWSNLPSEVR